MSKHKIIKKYRNADLTIIWQPDLCIHSGICVQMLPEVYKPNERPWVTIENASTEELIEQIKSCPSQALTYELHRKDKPKQEDTEPQVTLECMLHGPLIVSGNVEITHEDGTKEKQTNCAICRCNQSKKKPFCDGSHRALLRDYY